MQIFLNKLVQLHFIQEVLLLSVDGEPLFYKIKNKQNNTINVSSWNTIINGMNSAVEAEFCFKKGIYYLHHLGIGYVVISLKGSGSIQKIKNACANLRIKLSDPAICKKVLLKMLHEADQSMKPQIVVALLPFADDEIVEALLRLLGKEGEYSSSISPKLSVNIFQVLGQSNSTAARRGIKKVLQDHHSGRIILENEQRYAAQVALAQLELDVPSENAAHLHQEKLIGSITVEDSSSPSAPSLSEDHCSAKIPEEQRIQTLFDQNKTDEAGSLILKQIEIYAGKKQFEAAEKLHEWLMQADPHSLRKIIRAAEIIEEAKSSSISDEYLKVWKDLADDLSTEDFSSLYHAMIHKHYKNGDFIVRQGEILSNLFFINSGRVQIYSTSYGGEYLLKVADAGEILGSDTFFDISTWTMSIKSLGADVSLLTWNGLSKLKESNPALKAKLMDFCSRFKLTNTDFNRRELTRRRFERVRVSGKVTVAALTKAGAESFSGTKGDLLNLSRGGLAFSLRFSKKKNAITLLGQGLRISVRFDCHPVPVHWHGVVKAVQCNDYIGHDYTIHVEFGEELSNSQIVDIVGNKS